MRRSTVWCVFFDFLKGCCLYSKNERSDLYSKNQDVFEMQADAIAPGQTVIVIDDLIATGTLHSIHPIYSQNSWT